MKKFLSLTSSYMKKSFFSSTPCPEKDTELERRRKKNKGRFWNCSCSLAVLAVSVLLLKSLSCHPTWHTTKQIFIVIVWLESWSLARKACIWMWTRAIVNNEKKLLFEHSLSGLNHRLHESRDTQKTRSFSFRLQFDQVVQLYYKIFSLFLLISVIILEKPGELVIAFKQ
jgi:hypothetical protein